jgi:hypothetical protein
MPRPKAAQRTKFTKATALRNVNMLRALKYVEEQGTASSEDVAAYLDMSTSTGREFLNEFLELGLVKFSHYDTTRVAAGPGFKMFKITEDAYERATKLLPTDWDGAPVKPAARQPVEGQHLMADDHRAPVSPTVVLPFRDPLVACLHGWGRAPSLNFMDSAKGG